MDESKMRMAAMARTNVIWQPGPSPVAPQARPDLVYGLLRTRRPVTSHQETCRENANPTSAQSSIPHGGSRVSTKPNRMCAIVPAIKKSLRDSEAPRIPGATRLPLAACRLAEPRRKSLIQQRASVDVDLRMGPSGRRALGVRYRVRKHLSVQCRITLPTCL